MDHETIKEHAHAPEYGSYIYVWLVLMGLLAVTIAVARIELSGYSVLVNLSIASIKAALVLLYFMHLRHEGWLIRGLLLLTLATITGVILLTYADTWYR